MRGTEYRIVEGKVNKRFRCGDVEGKNHSKKYNREEEVKFTNRILRIL